MDNLLSQYITNGSGYGKRYNSQDQKQSGYFGELPLDNGNVATEYSVDVPVNGKYVQAPSITPNQNANSLASILQSASTGSRMSDEAYRLAVQNARSRIGQGRSPFYGIPERQYVAPTVDNYSRHINTLDLFR